jgi:hypothetical protein
MAQEKRTDKEVDTPFVQGLKRQARHMSRKARLSLSAALDEVAKKQGYASWHVLRLKNPPETIPVKQNRLPGAHLASPSDRTYHKTVPVVYKKRRQIVPLPAGFTVDLRRPGPLSLRGGERNYEDGKAEDETLGAQMPFHGDQD